MKWRRLNKCENDNADVDEDVDVSGEEDLKKYDICGEAQRKSREAFRKTIMIRR
jgi:hypothetical protein